MSEPAPEQVDLLEALRTTPSRRYLAATPIPEAVLWELLDSAVRGPSGGNRQTWGWVVVTDPDVKAADRPLVPAGLGGRVRRSPLRAHRPGPGRCRHRPEPGLLPGRGAPRRAPGRGPGVRRPGMRGAADSTDKRLGSSIYGAVQQLLLAARAYGIGGVLTTLHLVGERDVDELLGLPEDTATMGLVPLGYPVRGRWSTPRRQPVEEVVHWERWGTTRTRG